MTTNPRIPFQLSTDRKVLTGPDGKRILVHVVINVENWRFDSPMPRKIITAPHGAEAVPDIPNFAWAEYGMRCGMPRILRAIGERGLTASATVNAGVIGTYPRLAEAVAAADLEIMGHGLDQRSLQGEDGEAEVIGRALEVLSDFTGAPIRGWLGPGLKETDETPDILKEAGIDFLADWVLDDLPCWMRTRSGPLIALPYSLEINDSVLHAMRDQPSDEMLRRLELSLATFDRETHLGPRVVTLALHPHLIGVPHRIGCLERMLDLLMARDDAVFLQGSAIADWYKDAEPAPSDLS